MTTPQDPGNPEYTDPEATSPEQAEAEAAAAESAAAADAAQESELDPTLEADLEEALADVEPDADGDGEVSDLEAQLAERTEDLQRVTAEYANYRRRTERERQAVVETAKAKVIAEFLPILDDLDLARQHGDLEEGPLKAIATKLEGILTGQKLAPFGEEGDAFDPEIHEAVQDLSSGGEQVLGTVLRRGYRVGERLVRTAMVIIADPAPASDAAADGAVDAAGTDAE